MVIITVIKELANEFDGEFNCLGENTIKYIIFSVPIGWKVRKIGDNREEITKTISNKKNSLSEQDFWQPLYQIMLIFFLKKFIKLKVNMDMIVKNVKQMELNKKIVIAFLNTQTLKKI